MILTLSLAAAVHDPKCEAGRRCDIFIVLGVLTEDSGGQWIVSEGIVLIVAVVLLDGELEVQFTL
jgi:hypothetical protein